MDYMIHYPGFSFQRLSINTALFYIMHVREIWTSLPSPLVAEIAWSWLFSSLNQFISYLYRALLQFNLPSVDGFRLG